MKKELTNIIIESKTEIPYFNQIVEYYNLYEKDILKLFRLNNFKNKYRLIIMSYDEFRSYLINKYGECKSYVRGDTDKGSRTIRILTIEDQIKYTTHKDTNMDEYLKMIIHEFIHACHNEVNSDYNSTIWFYEGLATNLAHQKYNIQDLSKCNFELLKNNWYEYPDNKYAYAYTIVNYIINNRSVDEVYKLISDSNYLRLSCDKMFMDALKKDWRKKYDSKE